MKSIGKHLLDHENFKTCYSNKIEFVENHLEIIKQKELQNRSNDLLNSSVTLYSSEKDWNTGTMEHIIPDSEFHCITTLIKTAFNEIDSTLKSDIKSSTSNNTLNEKERSAEEVLSITSSYNLQDSVPLHENVNLYNHDNSSIELELSAEKKSKTVRRSKWVKDIKPLVEKYPSTN
ncbi:2557_t:CDS:2 [Entrophospora sp. SA101]|nr:2557_t:CDS:2 [Entrophospora sp. SA101]